MGIPSALIPALRVALRSQGFPDQTLRDDGTLNAAGLLAGVYDEVEFRTALSPSVVLKTKELLNQGPPNPFVQYLKPTVIMRGRGEETIIAPVGVATPGGWLPGIGAVVVLVGAGFLLGRMK